MRISVKFNNTFFLLMFIFSVLGFGLLVSPVYANTNKNSILHISFTDSIAITDEGHDALNSLIQSMFPENDLISVKVKTNRLGLFEFWGRRKLIKSLQEVIQKDTHITHLVIETHGTTKKSWPRESSSTILGYLGAMTENGPDQKFQEIFNPILNHFSEKLTIVLNSCSTMCGTDKEKKNRAEQFLKYFGATKGRIYGSYTLEVESYLLEREQSDYRLRNFIPGVKSSLMTAALITPLAFLGAPYVNMFIEMFGGTEGLRKGHLMFVIATTPIMVTIANIINLAKVMAEKINAGNIFFYDKNGVMQMEKINKRLKNLPTIYNQEKVLSCKAILN